MGKRAEQRNVLIQQAHRIQQCQTDRWTIATFSRPLFSAFPETSPGLLISEPDTFCEERSRLRLSVMYDLDLLSASDFFDMPLCFLSSWKLLWRQEGPKDLALASLIRQARSHQLSNSFSGVERYSALRKGNKQRIIPLGDTAIKILKDFLKVRIRFKT